jgi:hypothetical protein
LREKINWKKRKKRSMKNIQKGKVNKQKKKKTQILTHKKEDEKERNTKIKRR